MGSNPIVVILIDIFPEADSAMTSCLPFYLSIVMLQSLYYGSMPGLTGSTENQTNDLITVMMLVHRVIGVLCSAVLILNI